MSIVLIYLNEKLEIQECHGKEINLKYFFDLTEVNFVISVQINGDSMNLRNSAQLTSLENTLQTIPELLYTLTSEHFSKAGRTFVYS